VRHVPDSREAEEQPPQPEEEEDDDDVDAKPSVLRRVLPARFILAFLMMTSVCDKNKI
jgi:hypothetical protein